MKVTQTPTSGMVGTAMGLEFLLCCLNNRPRAARYDRRVVALGEGDSSHKAVQRC